jgi:thymidylate synthase
MLFIVEHWCVYHHSYCEEVSHAEYLEPCILALSFSSSDGYLSVENSLRTDDLDCIDVGARLAIYTQVNRGL